MSTWQYLLLCLAVPSVWGVAMFYAFDLVARRRKASGAKDTRVPPVDYSI